LQSQFDLFVLASQDGCPDRWTEPEKPELDTFHGRPSQRAFN